jgi:hypothetical protein
MMSRSRPCDRRPLAKDFNSTSSCLSGVEESNFRSYHDSNRIAAQLPVATKEGSMQQVNREFGKLNPNAPSELSRFAFLIGKWRYVRKPGSYSV